MLNKKDAVLDYRSINPRLKENFSWGGTLKNVFQCILNNQGKNFSHEDNNFMYLSSLFWRLHCPVLENKWENGERTGSDSDACQISTRLKTFWHVGSCIKI